MEVAAGVVVVVAAAAFAVVVATAVGRPPPRVCCCWVPWRRRQLKAPSVGIQLAVAPGRMGFPETARHRTDYAEHTATVPHVREHLQNMADR